MFILHLAFGGCLSPPPIRYGITSDTGGHIAYVLNAVRAQRALPGVCQVSVVTRLFDDARLGNEYSLPSQRLHTNATIDRIETTDRRYLEKEALSAEMPFLEAAFLGHLERLAALPDVIHAHFSDAAAIAGAAGVKFGIPVVYTPHALGLDKQNSGRRPRALQTRVRAERDAIRSADAIVVSTRDEADRQVAAYGVPMSGLRIECLPPGVPQGTTDTADGPMDLDLDQWLDDAERPVILAIARPVKKKNLASLVRAFAASSALRERANLVILAGQHGAGLHSAEERRVIEELKRLCADGRLRGRVALPPHHTPADVNGLYRLAAAGGVFVNPALHEPFGLTLIEAAAVGVPVVATRNGGPGDILAATGHGLLVDPRDEAALGAACLRILSDPVLHARLSQAGRMHAPLFSWARYAERSVALYRSLERPRRTYATGVGAVMAGFGEGHAARHVTGA